MENMENISSPVDFERLREISDNDTELINDLVELYFTQTDEQLTELQKAISANDFDSIYKSAHKIAGGSLTCGMNAIVPSIRELEKSGRNQTAENVEQLLVESQQAFVQMKEYLENNKEQLFS